MGNEVMESRRRQSAVDRPLLKVSGLRIEGQSDGVWRPIIKEMGLELQPGEVLGLVGESGAGKSTLGLSAMGYVRPGCRFVSGSVSFDGIDLFAISDAARRKVMGSRIAYVAQSAAASFNPAIKIIDQVVETTVDIGLMSRDKAEQDARNLFHALNLPNPESIGDRYPHQVSGGQLQRAMVAMAMSCRPDLIVFDEPTTALDVTTQVEVLAAMRDVIERHNTAAIYITHDLAVVSQMAHRIMVMRHGRVVEEAPTADILSSPRQDYTKSLWSVRKLTKAQDAAPSDEPLLQVRSVHASYGRVSVIKDVTIDLPRGRTLAVVGESGSGKSTLARVITGLLPPSEGEIVLNGKSLPKALADRNKSVLQKIQLVYQSADNALNPKQTIGDIIARPLEFYLGLTGRAREKRVAELLEMIELDHSYIRRLPGELSGGQKQRVSIARALAADPALIICDEVTSALDQIIQQEILQLLMRLQKDAGLSYLFITHDIATVRAIADFVVVMFQGKIVEQGHKSEVLSPPYEPYTERLLSSVPEMDPGWLTHLLEVRGACAQAASG